jgi:hypothetical protein
MDHGAVALECARHDENIDKRFVRCNYYRLFSRRREDPVLAAYVLKQQLEVMRSARWPKHIDLKRVVFLACYGVNWRTLHLHEIERSNKVASRSGDVASIQYPEGTANIDDNG